MEAIKHCFRSSIRPIRSIIEICSTKEEEETDCIVRDINNATNWFSIKKKVFPYYELITEWMPVDQCIKDEFWVPLIYILREHRFCAWDVGCYHHIEYKNIHTISKAVDLGTKLLFIYNYILKDIRPPLRAHFGLNNRTMIRTIMDADAPKYAAALSPDVLRFESVVESVERDLSDIILSSGDTELDVSRVYDLNGVVKIRSPRASLVASRISSQISLFDRIVQYSDRTPWANISQDDFITFLNVTNCHYRLKIR